MRKKLDLTNERYGRLVVVRETEPYVSPKGEKVRQWECICDCGSTVAVSQSNLRTGNTNSCGCLSLERVTKHEGKGTRLYNIWRGMRSRVKESSREHKKYYDKGVKVCDEWEDFAEFKKWSLDNGYTEDLTIDRIDSNKDYQPDNCRWVTMSVQNYNKTLDHRNKTGVVGVRWLPKDNRWNVRIQDTRINKYLSKNFQSFEEAIAWRKSKEVEIYGETLEKYYDYDKINKCLDWDKKRLENKK